MSFEGFHYHEIKVEVGGYQVIHMIATSIVRLWDKYPPPTCSGQTNEKDGKFYGL